MLHDTVEDTVATIDEIEHLFGDEVARLVDGVTKLSKLELQLTGHADMLKIFASSFWRFRKISGSCWSSWLTACTTCGRSIIFQSPKRAWIARETMDIHVPLAERIGIQDIAEELEEMAFRELYPEVAESIENRPEFTQGEDVVNLISGEVNRVLAEADL